MSYLHITAAQFKFGYDLNFTPYISQQYNGADYLSWSACRMLMATHFSNLVIAYDKQSYTYGGDDAQNGVILHPYLVDTETDARTEAIAFPVMDSRQNAIAYPDARQMSDNIQRANVKCVATNLGIGLRLWTREGIDATPGVKSSNKDHPKFKLLMRLNDVLSECDNLSEDFEAPNFGMSVTKLTALGKSLTSGEPAPESKNAIAEGIASQIASWKSPEDAINWAITKLGKPIEEVLDMYTETKADEQGRKAKPFYDRVMQLAG